MRVSFVRCAGAFLLAGVSVVHGQQQFAVFARVVGADGAPVTSLQASDVHLTESGAEARLINVEPVSWPTKLQI
jgi:hypothetical protein